MVRVLQADAPSAPDVDGLIVDAHLGERPALLQALMSRWSVPVLVESPVAADVQVAERLVAANGQPVERTISPGGRVVAANPLRYGLHTRRLQDELAQADDPLQTLFAAWRFKPWSSTAEALPRLLDFLRGVCPAEPTSIAAMRSRDASLLRRLAAATPRCWSRRCATRRMCSAVSSSGVTCPRRFPARPS